MSKAIPSIEEMLEAGVHFGHRSNKWHPKMAPYIFGVRNGVHVIDLEQTVTQLEKTQDFIDSVVARGGKILFLGTKAQSREIIKAEADRANSPYVMNRWIGGLLTNFQNVSKLSKNLKDLTKQRDTGELNKYTKKEQIGFEKEIARLEMLVGGLREMDRIPAAIFIVDIKTEKTALLEAVKRGVPVIAMCDTNVDPSKVSYVIPANDDAKKGIAVITKAIADMVIEAQAKAPKEDPTKLKVIKK